MFVTQQSLIQAAADLNAGKDGVLQGAGPDAGRTYTIHKSNKVGSGVGTNNEVTADVLGTDGLMTFAHNVSNWDSNDPKIYTEQVTVVSGDLKSAETFQVWKPTAPVMTDPIHRALVFILDHLSKTAIGPSGTEAATAAQLKADFLDEFYPASDAPKPAPVERTFTGKPIPPQPFPPLPHDPKLP